MVQREAAVVPLHRLQVHLFLHVEGENEGVEAVGQFERRVGVQLHLHRDHFLAALLRVENIYIERQVALLLLRAELVPDRVQSGLSREALLAVVGLQLLFLVPAVPIHFDVRSEGEALDLLEIYRDARFVLMRVVHSHENNTLDLEFLRFSIHVDKASDSLLNFHHDILSKGIMCNRRFGFLFLYSFTCCRFSKEVFL